MSPTRAIDPELAAALARMPTTKYGAFDLDDLPGTRAMMREMTERMTAGLLPDPTVRIGDERLAREDGTELTLRIFRPDGPDAVACVLWFHAGGQILARADEDDLYLAALAARLGVAVVAVDYRLAPEHQAPAAAEDGLASYRHLLAHADRLGIDSERLAIGGASGGGAPALATALMIRDHGIRSPRAITLLYPMIDDRNITPSSREITDVGVWDREANLLAWKAVLGDRVATDRVGPYDAPARATDLTGLPPVFIAAAEFDVLRDEDVDLAMRILRGGGQVELHLVAGAIHAWDRFVPGSALAEQLDRDWHLFLTRYLVPATADRDDAA